MTKLTIIKNYSSFSENGISITLVFDNSIHFNVAKEDLLEHRIENVRYKKNTILFYDLVEQKTTGTQNERLAYYFKEKYLFWLYFGEERVAIYEISKLDRLPSRGAQ